MVARPWSAPLGAGTDVAARCTPQEIEAIVPQVSRLPAARRQRAAFPWVLGPSKVLLAGSAQGAAQRLARRVTAARPRATAARTSARCAGGVPAPPRRPGCSQRLAAPNCRPGEDNDRLLYAL